jgi:hypothetical protein
VKPAAPSRTKLPRNIAKDLFPDFPGCSLAFETTMIIEDRFVQEIHLISVLDCAYHFICPGPVRKLIPQFQRAGNLIVLMET